MLSTMQYSNLFHNHRQRQDSSCRTHSRWWCCLYRFLWSRDDPRVLGHWKISMANLALVLHARDEPWSAVCKLYIELYRTIRKSIDTNETNGICKRQVSVLLAKLDKLAIQQSNHSDRLRIRDADVVEGPVLQRDKFSVLFLQVHAWMYTFYRLHMYIILYEWCFGHLHTMQKITMFISFLWASKSDSWWSTPKLLQTSISHFHESQAVLTGHFWSPRNQDEHRLWQRTDQL